MIDHNLLTQYQKDVLALTETYYERISQKTYFGTIEEFILEYEMELNKISSDIIKSKG